MASKVENWVQCDLRYVGETKLARLHDEELSQLYAELVKKHDLPYVPLSGARDVQILTVMALKAQISKKDVSVSATAPEAVSELATAPATTPTPYLESEPTPEPTPVQEPVPEPVQEPVQELVPEPAQEPVPESVPEELVEEITEAAKAFDKMFEKETEKDEAASKGKPVVLGATPPEELAAEDAAAKEDREARVSAFVQLAAAVSPPVPTVGDEKKEADKKEAVTVDSHHRLRICSFNACKLRLGSANKAYQEACDSENASEEYEGTHKGAELAQKWLTLASRMADFDVILLQEVPGSDKVMNEKIETFANLLDIATEEGQFWSAINSEKSGKDGKTTGPSAEVHVCFIKSPLQFKGWNTLRKVGATELDYAPLQVLLHDERFADPADRDFVVTSVHLPPANRADSRDNQISALLRNYTAPDTSEYRMQQPLKPSKEVRISPTHVIAGDFNAFPGSDQYNLSSCGFVSKIPKNASTTSGHQNYDNVLVDGHSNDRLLIGGGIMQLKDPHNAAKGEVGLSDHYPVFVEVCEVQKTRKASPKAEPESKPEPAVAPEPKTVVEDETETKTETETVVEDDMPPLEPVTEEQEEQEEPVTEEPAAEEPVTEEPVAEEQPMVEDVMREEPVTEDVVREEPVMEDVVREVVSACMDEICKDLDVTPTPAEEPPAAGPATEEPPSAPPPAPAPAPGTPPMAAVLEKEFDAAWRAAIAEPFPAPAPPLPQTPASAPFPDELTTLASETDSESESTPPPPPPPPPPMLLPDLAA